ncbi:MAG TPA: hypothetical protein VI455_09760 [Terriglobia bacterium]
MRARSVIGIAGVPAMLAAALAVCAPPLAAQSCQDERAMSEAMVKDAAVIVDTVKKESEADFVAKFHQKSCLTKLTFSINALGEAIDCLDKAGQNASTPADQAASDKAAKEADAKLRDRLSGYKTALKAAEDPKNAKALIGTFDLSMGAAK